MKRNIIIPAIFIVYIAVVAYIGYPHFSENGQQLEFAALLIVNLIVVFLLHLLLRRRDSQRQEIRKRKQAASHRSLRNDNIR